MPRKEGLAPTLADAAKAEMVLEQIAKEDGVRQDEWGAVGPAHPVTAETRRPLGRLVPRLDNTPIPGFHVRWINDDGEGRIANAIAAGYAFVDDAEGRHQSKVVGTKRTGGPMIAYRMKVPLEWWLADRGKIEQGREALLAEMMRGKIGRGAEDGRYLPERAGQIINSMTTTDGRLK